MSLHLSDKKTQQGDRADRKSRDDRHGEMIDKLPDRAAPDQERGERIDAGTAPTTAGKGTGGAGTTGPA